MRILKIITISLFTVFFFGVPLLAIVLGPSTYRDVNPVEFDKSFFAPATSDRSLQIKNWYQSRKIGTSFIGHRNTMDAYIFRSVDSQNVVSGRKPGWLFLKGQFQKCQEVEKIIEAFERIDTIDMLYEPANVNFAVVVAPDKSAIYPEYVPKWGDYDRCLSGTNHIFRSNMDKQPHAVIDIFPTLIKAKEFEKTYYPKDTHWNVYGFSVAIEYIYGALFDVPFADVTEIGSSVKASTTITRAPDLAILSRMRGMDQEMEISFQPPLSAARTEILNSEIIIIHDSFFNIRKTELQTQMPNAKFSHIARLPKEMPRLTGNEPLEPGTTIIVQSVQRDLTNRFRAYDKNSVSAGKKLLLNAMNSNIKRAQTCNFEDAEKLDLSTKRNKSETENKTGLNFESTMRTSVFARIPETDVTNLTCLRIRYESNQRQDFEGALYFELIEKTGFRRGLRIPATSKSVGNEREFRIILPKRLQGKQIRFDPRMSDVKLSNFTIEATNVLGSTSIE